jgi:hypothetical protein
LQVTPVGDVGGDGLPGVWHLQGLVHDRVHLGGDELSDHGVDEASPAAEPAVDGGLADPGGSGDLLQRSVQPAAATVVIVPHYG